MILDEYHNFDEPKHRPGTPDVYAELKTSLDKKEAEKKEPQPLHASDNHINYIVERTKAWRDEELAKGFKPDMGARLQLFAKDNREPFDIQTTEQSKQKNRDLVRQHMPKWQLSDAKRGIEGRPQKARDILAGLVYRTEILQKNSDVRAESADTFVEFLANGMSIGKKTNPYYIDPYYGSLYVLNSEFQKEYQSSEGKEQFGKNREEVRNFLRTKTTEKGMQLEIADFTHFNTVEPASVTDRIYIALNPFGKPAEGLRAWWQALEDAELEDKLYFKIFGGVSDRLDSIVVYPSDSIDPAKLAEALENFQRNVPKDALLDKATDTGVELGRGMSYATEVDDLVMVHKLLDPENKRTSFGILLSQLSATAMQLGYREIAQKARATGTDKISLGEVSKEAKRYLRELFICADINPDTMVPWNRGGKLPDWAKNIRGELLNQPRTRVNLSA